ncbi:acyl-CoA dehydrogenase [Oleomonas cavernae]|uniref:Acyl-CoA dehydrogenase n=1 Tax=Oleomonas cavernae TaxID=2320859 RepID=A0A418W8D4_9PROT|nr:acyl-CoA dehydrogenase family protein [Oleomonas cavernae]RJF86277.1 acyl-CoA dehydrogenase [Oleomonas cavernae]
MTNRPARPRLPYPIKGGNFYALDGSLQRLLGRLIPDSLARQQARLEDFGAFCGGPVEEAADYTDRFAPPRLETYDRSGRMVNVIHHNPAWDAVSREVYERGAVGLAFGEKAEPYTLTFAFGYLLGMADISLHCPVTMTGAVAYVLDRFAPESVRERYLPEMTRMDGQALTGGTWATEHHGGSDIGATTTRATLQGDGTARLTGLKWFTSNANGGLALATARPEGAPEGSKGLGAYLVPTHRDDGAPNSMRIRRLKEKLGTKGIPTGEIDLIDTWAVEVAPPPRGFKLMVEALEFSRIHNAMGSVGVQRRAYLEALGYADQRAAFGHTITDYPMVQDELLKMLVAHEAGLVLAFESARAFDAAHGRDVAEAETAERAWLRVATALAKYQTAEDACATTRGAIELIGGNGYTADHVTPRLLRDAQVLTVWEGPANIQALELLRLLGNRLPGFETYRARIEKVTGSAPPALSVLARSTEAGLAEVTQAVALLQADAALAQRHARRLLALMAEVLAAALLLESAVVELGQGNARMALVTRLFIETRVEPLAHRGIVAGREWTSRYFEALAFDGVVDPSAVASLPAMTGVAA